MLDQGRLGGTSASLVTRWVMLAVWEDWRCAVATEYARDEGEGLPNLIWYEVAPLATISRVAWVVVARAGHLRWLWAFCVGPVWWCDMDDGGGRGVELSRMWAVRVCGGGAVLWQSCFTGKAEWW